MRNNFGKIVLGVMSGWLLLSFITNRQTSTLVNPAGVNISERFLLPAGYTRVAHKQGSFGEFLQHTALKPHGTLVHLYNGVEKPARVEAAVLSYDVGSRDLQQCADAVMRLRAEYLYQAKQYEALHFNFTSGFNAAYAKWRKGNRVVVKGNVANWVKTSKESTSYQSFREYLNMVFMYAGTASLAKELKPVPLSQMQVGDVFIFGGSPGHAVTVVDMAINAKTNKKLFMIAQSYMPAQDIHILINKNKPSISPWYELDEKAELIYTPEWTFEPSELKRF
jgi:hypothetical protein